MLFVNSQKKYFSKLIKNKIYVGSAEEDEGLEAEGGGARGGEGLPEHPHTREKATREGRDGRHNPRSTSRSKKRRTKV